MRFIFCVLCLLLSFSAWARFPVVFVHGLGISAGAYDSLAPLKELFQKHGYELYIAHTPAYDTIEQRALVLKLEVEKLIPQGYYHLVGHSMGGLDSRFAIHKYNLGQRCLSLTSLASPHYGTPLASLVVKLLHAGKTSHPLVQNFTKLFGKNLNPIKQLTPEHTSMFNQTVQNDRRVRYFSMSFYIPKPIAIHSFFPSIWFLHSVIENEGEPLNDGMVGVASTIWGESLGVFPSDHLAETGPFPFRGGLNREEVFEKVIENLNSF